MGSGQHIRILQNCSVDTEVYSIQVMCEKFKINKLDLVEDNKSSTKHDYRKSRMSLFLRPMPPLKLFFQVSSIHFCVLF